MDEKFAGSLVGRRFVVKLDRSAGTARTPWAVYERLEGDIFRTVLKFVSGSEAKRLIDLLESMGADVEVEELKR